MPFEIDDKELDDAIEQDRHDEIVSKLQDIVESLNKEDDDKICAALENNSSIVKGLIDSVKAIANQEKQEVSIETNQDKVIDAISKMETTVLDALKLNTEELKRYNDRPIVNEFELIKNEAGYTQRVKVHYKK